VAAIHAAALRRHPASAFHRAALGIALAVGGAAALLQPISGDFSARQVAVEQPVKLAALEAPRPPSAPLRLGLPDRGPRTPYSVGSRGLNLAFHDRTPR
jgi:cytochrome d ubiquinol oxidase subunit I